MASESSDKKNCYVDCGLRIETKPGWEKSLTMILSSFEDLMYAIDPNQGFARIRGKIDPQLVLMKLKKAGKHASVDWITYGPQREEKDNQSHALETSRNNLYGFCNPYNYRLYNNLNAGYDYPNIIDHHLGHEYSHRKCRHKDFGYDSIPCHERRRSDYSRHRHSQEESSSKSVDNKPSPRAQSTHHQCFHQGQRQGTHLKTAIKAIVKPIKKLFSSSKGLLGTCANHASKKWFALKSD